MNKYLIKKAKDGKLYFTLSASNGQIICKSGFYSSKAGVLNGIESVRRHASTEIVEYENQSTEEKIE